MINDNTILKKILGFSMATWISALASFILMPIITRLVTPYDLGRIDLFITYSTMFVYASTLGMHQSYMRFYNENLEGLTKESLFCYSARVCFFGSIVCGAFYLFFYEYFSKSILGYSTMTIALLMFVFTLSYGYLNFSKTKPRMEQNVMQYTFIVLGLSLAVKIPYLFYYFWKDCLFIISIITACVFSLFIIDILSNRNLLINKLQDVKRKNSIEIFKYALPTVPIMFISNTNVSLPKVLLGHFCDSKEVGVYAAAGILVSIITIMQSGINVFWSPYVFKHYREKKAELQRLHIMISCAIVIFGLLLLLFQDFIFEILGSSYRESKFFYSLLLASPIFYTIGETVGVGINISKKTYWNIITTFCSLLTNFILGYLLIPKYMGTGAAVGVMMSAFILLILKAYIGERYYNVIANPIKSVSIPVIYILATVVTMLFFKSQVVKNLLLTLLIIILLLIFGEELSLNKFINTFRRKMI